MYGTYTAFALRVPLTRVQARYCRNSNSDETQHICFQCRLTITNAIIQPARHTRSPDSWLANRLTSVEAYTVHFTERFSMRYYSLRITSELHPLTGLVHDCFRTSLPLVDECYVESIIL